MMQNSAKLLIAGALMIMTWSSCGNKTEEKQEQTAVKIPETDTTPEPKQVKKEDKKDEAPVTSSSPTGYSAYPIKGVDSALKVFRKKYTVAQRWEIMALNRVDDGHVGRIDTLIIPDTIVADFKYYSPFPQEVQALQNVNKMAIFSYAIQAFAAYEHGHLVYWGPTSMGAKIHPTPLGLHFTNWKSKESISTVSDEWKLKWNFNIANGEGVGWHQYALPGYPASHSCLRLLDEQAAWLYTWADQWILKDSHTILAQGTPVLVYGQYPFGSRRPWRNLLEDANANKISEDDLSKELQPIMDKIMAAQSNREKVVAEKKGNVVAADTTSTATQSN